MKPKRERTHSSSSYCLSVSSSDSRSNVDSPSSSDSSDSGKERQRDHVSYFNNFAKGKEEHRKLPPISAAQLRKIRRLEYIDFDNLLSSALYAPAAYNGPSYHLNLTSASTLSVKATNTAKPRVVDFHTWLEAWNNCIQASIFHHPELTSQLPTYQANICQFAGKYNIGDVLNYDVLVRRDLAYDHSFSWDAIYDSHFEANLKDKTQTQCYYCH